jgi:hypothetical protein
MAVAVPLAVGQRNLRVWADSRRHRADFVEFLLGNHIVQRFSWSSFEALLDYFEVFRVVQGEVGSFR